MRKNSVALLMVGLIMTSAVLAGEDAVKSKLEVLKARGLDFSGATFFLPFADERGNFPYADGACIRDQWKNKSRPVSFYQFPVWQENSRLKGQYCLYFDGKNVLGTSGGGMIFKPADSHTISAWVAFEEPVGVFNIFVEGHAGIRARTLSYYYGYLTHSLYGGPDGQIKSASAAIKYSPVPYVWTHIVGVYDREKKKIQLYVNGKMVKEESADIPPIELKKSGFYIGVGKEGDGLFKGWMDELAAFNRPFTADEVAALYAKGIPDAGCEKVMRPARHDKNQKEFVDGVSLGDVWFYADFDNKTAPVYSAGPAGAVSVRQDFGSAGPLFSPGKFGNALLIRGADQAGKTMNADSLDYDMNFPEGQFTVSFWFKPDPAKWEAAKKNKRWLWPFFSTRFDMVSLGFKGGQLNATAGAATGTAGDNILVSGAMKWPVDKWTHIVLSSAATGKTTLYVDGKPLVSKSLPYGRQFTPVLSLGKTWVQSKSSKDNGERLDGWLDDFLVLRTALSETAVKKIFESGKPVWAEVGGVGFPSIRRVFKRGETILFPVRLPFGGNVDVSVTPVGLPGAKPLVIASGEVSDCVYDLTWDSKLLRPGDYDVAVSVTKGATTERGAASIRILPSSEPSIPFGIYDVTKDLESMPDYLRKWHDIGINYVRVGGRGDPYSRFLFMDALYRYGIEYVPNLGTSNLSDEDAAGLKPEEYKQLPVGARDFFDGHISLFSEVGAAKIIARIKKTVAECSQHPGFKFVSLYDEYELRHDLAPGALRYFKSKTGLDAFPSFEARPKGTLVADNDPYARWVDTFGVGQGPNKGLAYHSALMTEAVRQVNPSIRTMAQWSDGHGGTSVSTPEIYPYLAETDHRRDIGATELMAESGIEKFRSGDMNRPRRPVWPLLGWWSIPALPGFNESIKVLTEVSLAKGAKGLLYAADTWVNRDDMAGSVRHLAAFRDVYGPFLNSLRYEDLGTIALLWNDYEMLGVKDPGWRPDFSADYRLAAAVRLAGIPYEFVHTDQVLAGELKRFDGVLLSRFDYATVSLKKKIDEFAASGGVVFAAKGNTALAPTNAIAYDPGEFSQAVISTNDAAHGNMQNVQFLAPKLRKLVLPVLKTARPIYADNNYFACYYVPGAGCDVYFIINTDLYLDQSGVVTFARPLSNAYSLVDNKPLGAVGNALPLSLKKGEWQVIADYAHSLPAMKIKARCKGSSLRYTVALPAKVVAPITVRFFDPSGREVEDYRQYGVTDRDGVYSGLLTFATLNDPRGKWKVVAEFPFADRKVEAVVSLRN